MRSKTSLVYVAGLDGTSLYVLLNNQKGGFTESTITSGPGSSDAVVLADLNLDGNLDAVVHVVGIGTTAFVDKRGPLGEWYRTAIINDVGLP